MSSRGWENFTEADIARINAQRGLPRLEARPVGSTGIEIGVTKRAKFGNKKTLVDGILFDSGHEADRYLKLTDRQALGLIRDLELQPQYGIFACELSSGRGIEVANFKADFRYFDLEQNRTRIEDAKSDGTKGETAYRLRKKLVEACHNITIEEV